MRTASKTANLMANILLAVAVLVFVAFSASRYLFRERGTNAHLSDGGKRLVLPGVDFAQTSMTVLLALSNDCRYCGNEMPFYRRLVEEGKNRNVKVVAVFQHEASAGRQYLSNQQLNVTDVFQVGLKPLGINETPTLMLVSPQGEVLAKWVGVVPKVTENYILEILGKDEAFVKKTSSSFSSVGPAELPPVTEVGELARTVRDGGSITILDLDDRQTFAKEHLTGAVNIPRDEVLMRGLNELPMSNSIVLFSRNRTPASIASAKAALEEAGFQKITWLDVSLQKCKQAGLPVSSQELPK